MAGLCAACVNARVIESSKGARFIRCELSFTDTRFARYPRLPVTGCGGFRTDTPGGTELAHSKEEVSDDTTEG